MKVFVFMSLLSFTLAEPPVGDGYPSSRSAHHHDHGHQGSLTQEYGVPEFGARNQQEYAVTAARSQPSKTYGTPTRSSISREYGTPNLRSGLSQEYGPPSFRSAPSLQYGVPHSRGLSPQYGPPTSHSSPSSQDSYKQDVVIQSARLSQDFAPQVKSASLPSFNASADYSSDSYSVPPQGSYDYNQLEQRTPSQGYGVPSQRSNEQSPANKYGPPGLRSAQSFGQIRKQASSAGFNAKTSSVTRSFQSSFGSKNSASPTSGTPRSLSTVYGAPSSRNFNSYSQSPKTVSQTYLPSSRTVSQSYGVPSERGVSTEYGVPENDFNLKNSAEIPQYDLARSPSSLYGAPEARMPSEQYGTPQQYSSQDSQGYNYDRNALDELLNQVNIAFPLLYFPNSRNHAFFERALVICVNNIVISQEPANYDFGYKVNDLESGSDFGHSETRQENRAEGSYFVVLPDGTKQIVEYEADERGFKPRISVEQVDVRSGGYDDNAADLQRSADGPY
ncbi:pro-resilin-like isoform X1 [Danaus plexippus]|uniref:pro-resilin-like isoform X1 n=1 Tax=Danaus plexippus TaxID=13037 RepID=UPI002AB1D3E1|nr:pro-resilin-like isoform X1 [Danaus plexippus]